MRLKPSFLCWMVISTLRLTAPNIALSPGGFAYVPPFKAWSIGVEGEAAARLIWIRKLYQPADGLDPPDPIVTSDAHLDPYPMPDTDGVWSTTRFVDPNDMRHDMHVNIVNLLPGAEVPFTETHVMEHGLFVLQGMGSIG